MRFPSFAWAGALYARRLAARLGAAHADAGRNVEASVAAVLEDERQSGLDRLETYVVFSERVEATKRRLLEFLDEPARDAGKRIAAYGAARQRNDAAELLSHTEQTSSTTS